jgi:hypothetical protein
MAGKYMVSFWRELQANQYEWLGNRKRNWGVNCKIRKKGRKRETKTKTNTKHWLKEIWDLEKLISAEHE